MKHPFETFAADRLRKCYWLFLALTAVVAAILGQLARYEPDGTSAGKTMSVPTVAFEFARTPEAWNALQKEAGAAGMLALRTQTYADYAFLVCYSTLLAAAVVGVTRGCKSAPVVLFARGLAWAQWLAALMDAIENAGLIFNCSGHVSAQWTLISSTAAAIKFGIIGIGMLYIYIALACSWRDEPA